ncbi:hypothetical protein EVAR_10618_1 [Eumeta japonica]|uniref:Uncharacterized protein n=1 Tax=Eumeta variegata TaxID=151549 RepID=A0A4C1U1W3_EUMVA|nr:hypothetical protein EVAR_10618_1 [Eumeta japonica]
MSECRTDRPLKAYRKDERNIIRRNEDLRKPKTILAEKMGHLRKREAAARNWPGVNSVAAPSTSSVILHNRRRTEFKIPNKREKNSAVRPIKYRFVRYLKKIKYYYFMT